MTQFAKNRHSLVGLGGTFDHFHDGHKFFLKYASELSSHLVIGVTTKEMLYTKNFGNTIEPFSVRAKAVSDFCRQNRIDHKIIKLEDQYGPTILKESKIRALCVTKETVAGAEKINAIREAATFRPLPVYVANMVYDETGKEIHADRIRAGEISRTGKVYGEIFNQDILLSNSQKKTLSEPLGRVFESPKIDLLFKKLKKHAKNLPICVVGDESLKFFRDKKLPFHLGVFDGHTNRFEVSELSKELADQRIPKTENPAGQITTQAIKSLKQALANNEKYLKITGEEDLLTAALILLLPLESVLYYGQPDQGLVEIDVTEELKNKLYLLIN
jgi:pantetheine-phosphate adenylyltransferase